MSERERARKGETKRTSKRGIQVDFACYRFHLQMNVKLKSKQSILWSIRHWRTYVHSCKLHFADCEYDEIGLQLHSVPVYSILSALLYSYIMTIFRFSIRRWSFNWLQKWIGGGGVITKVVMINDVQPNATHILPFMPSAALISGFKRAEIKCTTTRYDSSRLQFWYFIWH